MIDTPTQPIQPQALLSTTRAVNINQSTHNFHLFNSTRLSIIHSSSSFSVSAHNVNSFCQPHKQFGFKQAVLHKHLDFAAIIDTRLKTSATRSVSSLLPGYRSFWAPLTSRTGHGGIGLFVNHPYSQFVQSLHTWRDLMLSVDLYMPGRKLRLIIVYCPPCSTSNNPIRQELLVELSKWISLSDREYYITGDFNTNADKFRDIITSCATIPTHYALLNKFASSSMVEIFPEFDSHRIPTFTRKAADSRNVLALSRIDSIWISQSLHVDILHTETWDTGNFYSSDHSMVIAWLAKSHLFSSLSSAVIKQHGGKKYSFSLSAMTVDLWATFSATTDLCLIQERLHHPPPTRPNQSVAQQLNRLWDTFSVSILKAAKSVIPRSWSNGHSNRRIPAELSTLYAHLAALNRILSYFSRSRLILGTTPGYVKWQAH